MKKNLFFKFFLLALVVILSEKSLAASLFFENNFSVALVGSEIKLSLLLDNQEEAINALEGSILFSDNLKFKKISLNGSIIPNWIEKPALEDNSIVFSGVIPAGFNGALSPFWKGSRPGKIFSIYFEAISQGEGSVWVSDDSRVLLNDGLGTQGNLSKIIFHFQNVIPDSSGSPKKQLAGLERITRKFSDYFKLDLVRNNLVEEGEWFIIFGANDKEDNISNFYVRENSIFEIGPEKEWQKATSPYILEDQNLLSYIEVKAVNESDVEFLKTIKPLNNFKFYYIPIGALIIIFVIIYLIVKIIKRYVKKK